MNQQTISIATVNVNGLNTGPARKHKFLTLHNSKNDIIFLQETHSLLESAQIWAREWKEMTNSDSVWHSGTSRSRGVAILFNNGFKPKIENERKDKKGRILTLSIDIDRYKLQLTNIYGPNKTNRRELFYAEVENHIKPDADVVLAGDFNMVLDPIQDRTGKIYKEHTKGHKNL